MSPTEQQARTRAKPMSPEERRAAIVRATLPLLEMYGGEVTTRQIAQAADIAEGTIFRVFPDKVGLFHAVLQQVVDPDLASPALTRALLGTTTLHDRVEAAATHLATRSRRVMTVMMALRKTMMSAGEKGPQELRPSFMEEAQARLQADLAEQVFEPFADQLRVTPVRAALVLRSLVLGVNHPGAVRGDSLSPADIADVILDGVARC